MVKRLSALTFELFSGQMQQAAAAAAKLTTKAQLVDALRAEGR